MNCWFKNPLKLLTPKKSSKFDKDENPPQLLNDWKETPFVRAPRQVDVVSLLHLQEHKKKQ